MNKVLRKRLLRDFKSNLARYVALILLIAMGMYIIVGMVGAAESIITGTEQNAIENKTEDGQFSVFIPLTKTQKKEITDSGVILEKVFSLDIEMKDNSDIEIKDNSIVRLMKNRNKIDLINLDEGKLAEHKNEVVLEKRYAQQHSLTVGDSITIADSDCTIVGIGSVPDYDMPIAKFSDVSVESESFGLAFVTAEQYDDIKENTNQKAEDYTYAYRITGDITDKELKEKIKDFEFDYNDVDNKYFIEMIADTIGKKDDVKDGISELRDGSADLLDGLEELDDNSDGLVDSAKALLDSYLEQGNTVLAASGVQESLTKDNYDEVLDKYIILTGSEDLSSLKTILDNLKKFYDGIVEYTDGVNKAYDGSKELDDGIADLKKETNELIDKVFDVKIDNLKTFIKAEDNRRIAAASLDVATNKQMGLMAGVIVLALFTYVISVFIIHQIQKESSVIGALYALGVKKKNLLLHYITLPTIISFAGGLIGAAIGFSAVGVRTQMADSYNYFSIPVFDTVYPTYLIIYSVCMPAVICIIVNYIVINKKLSQTALSLIKNEQKTVKYRDIKLKSKNFLHVFKIRQMLRESRTALTVILGMFISMLIFTLGINIWALCSNIQRENAADTKYAYMYTYKYPEAKVPEGGEAVYSETLSKTELGNTLDVTVMGIDDDNKYFSAKPDKGKNHIVIGSAVSEKYNLQEGDKLTLTDNSSETDYTFTVDGVAQYSVGLTVFMDIDSMRELFEQEDDYYNTVLADTELDIEEGRLYSVTTKEDIKKSSQVFMKLMQPTVEMLVVVSIIIFCVVMYLMMGVMIDRSSFGISLIKIFGFRTKEIRKLYLDGNTILVAIGALICIPVSKLMINTIFPFTVANVASGIDLSLPVYVYIVMFAAIMIIYFVINRLLVRKINKITPAEVLKNRD